MSSSITLTVRELRDASIWAKDHVSVVHAGNLPNSDLKIMQIPGAIGGRRVILCEACERVRVSDANHKDVTDYDCW